MKLIFVTLLNVLFMSTVLPAQDFHKDTNRTVLVTGAASGIGKATALKFRQAGYRVYATDLNVDDTADLTSAGCEVLFPNVTDEVSIQAAFATIAAKGDTIDISVFMAPGQVFSALDEQSMGQPTGWGLYFQPARASQASPAFRRSLILDRP